LKRQRLAFQNPSQLFDNPGPEFSAGTAAGDPNNLLICRAAMVQNVVMCTQIKTSNNKSVGFLSIAMQEQRKAIVQVLWMNSVEHSAR
jgi:hypothetical protein